ncbi:MAG: hypothetical protein IKV74_03040 [Clostridia bacterium]|nr:hypothetical protein [Clostridia bacterium]
MFYYANKRRRNKKIILIAVIAAAVIACVVLGIVFSDTIAGWFKSAPKAPETTQSPAVTATPIPEPQKPIEETGLTVLERFGVPEGFKRVSVAEGSFGAFLREYALKPYGTAPLFQDGTENTGAPTVGVLTQDLISKNQQSPDAIMWLYAEYLFEQGAYDEISFDLYITPVFHFDYATWLTGQRIVVVKDEVTNKDKIVWTTPEDAKPEEPSMASLRAYMIYVMMHANASSLKVQLSSATTDSLTVGDVFIDGHALVIMDVCVNEETGEKRFICAEGNTPATEMYILQNPETESVWLSLEADGTLVKGDKVFPADSVRRFE